MGSSKRSESEDSDQETSEVDLASISSLLKNDSYSGKDPLNQIKVRAQEQQRLSLGSFTKAKPPKGFSLEFTPDPQPAGSMVTEMISLGSPEKYELILHIANYGNKTVTAKIWEI